LAQEITARLKESAGKKIILGVRPEGIHRTPEAMGRNGQSVEAVVEIIELAGAERFVYLRRGKQSFVARLSRAEPVRVNEKLALTFDMSRAQFFDPVTGKAMLH
jgi:multiple sugar transport system ATP-binding protein